MKFTTINSTLGSIVLAVIALGFFPPVEATAPGFGVCLTGWEWSSNSEGQNPCEIAGSLQAPCLGYSVYTLGPLATDANYVTPQASDTTGKKCGCNTVIYSLYAACSLCQWPPNSVTVSWIFWSQFCDSVYVSQYPFAIPLNASVPHWAYLNDTTGIGFDPTLAQAAGRDPEATPPVPSTASLPSTSSTTHSLPTSTTKTPTPSTETSPIPSSSSGSGGSSNDNSGGSKNNDVGAITGGVVGGVLGLAIIATLALFILRRRDERTNAANNILAPSPMAYSPNMVDSKFGQPRMYNPADPSTFPPFPSGGDSSLSGGYTTNPLQPMRYSGAPEL